MTQISEERCLELIEAIATETFFPGKEISCYHYEFLAYTTVGQEVLNLTNQQQATLAIAMLNWLGQPNVWERYPRTYSDESYCLGANGVYSGMFHLMRRNLPYAYEDIQAFFSCLRVADHSLSYQLPTELTQAVEDFIQDNTLTPELQHLIEVAITRLDASCDRQFATRLRTLCQPKMEKLMIIASGEAWSDVAIQDINTLPDSDRSAWIQLVLTCTKASGSKPSAKWLKSAQALISKLGKDAFLQALLRWFPLVDKPRTQPITDWVWGSDPNLSLNDTNANILRGLVWLCAHEEQHDIARELGKLAISAYRKVPGVGPRCVRLGNACVWALGQMPGQAGLAQLALLKAKVKFGSAQKGIETALKTVAERIGLPREEVEELSVPTYGLETVGVRRETLGDFTVELVITGTSSAELRWFKSDGKPQKSVPKAIKDNYSEDLKDLKQAVKDIQTMLPAQRDRIEALYLQEKTWDLATWQTRYLNHPLMGTLARRLIWQFVDGDRLVEGIWHQDKFVNHADQPIDGLSDRTQVQLWHPITTVPDRVLAWRNWLVDHEVRQPFKQAHREIYRLTPAEERTRTYSNRFAAHILKQHQFNALCGQRGWKNQLRLMVDDVVPPATLSLPRWGIRAEFWVEGIGEEYNIDTTESGAYRYLTTDQVRFYAIKAAANFSHAYGGGYYSTSRADRADEPLSLETIPALVFSEVLRDVDLFVGVASVGNDPNWADGGPEARHYTYWHDYSFGELSETAKTRRQVLENLVPRLKIRDHCSFQDKFLVVRGDLRTYKIHLGSGNILMEPNDQYLCIVQNQGTTGGQNQIFLPFEGDNLMAVILSKAFLLAADTEIKDPTILAQIQ